MSNSFLVQAELEGARAFVIEAHGKQMYGKYPYIVHLDIVVGLLGSYFPDANILHVAGYLHDVVEDTSVTIEEIRDIFGTPVATLVHAIPNEPGKNRKERNAATYPKIAAIPDAVYLKLADRTCNVQECWKTKDHKLFMYHSEYKSFRKALHREDDLPARLLWTRLDKLLGWYDH